MYRYAVEITDRYIAWYDRRKIMPKRLAIAIRWAAIGLGGLGGVCPLLSTVTLFGLQLDLDRIGYVCFAIAGGLLLFDKTVGASSSWIRIIKTILNLKDRLDQFKFEWVGITSAWPPEPVAADGAAQGEDLSRQQVEAAIARISAYVAEIHGVLRAETETWVAEFKDGLAQLETMYKERTAQAPQSQPQGQTPPPAPTQAPQPAEDQRKPATP